MQLWGFFHRPGNTVQALWVSTKIIFSYGFYTEIILFSISKLSQQCNWWLKNSISGFQSCSWCSIEQYFAQNPASMLCICVLLSEKSLWYGINKTFIWYVQTWKKTKKKRSWYLKCKSHVESKQVMLPKSQRDKFESHTYHANISTPWSIE